jgi:hypothetical protein
VILILPEGLKFFQFGWWVIHAVAIYLVYSYALRRGRREERKAREAEKRDPREPERPPEARR